MWTSWIARFGRTSSQRPAESGHFACAGVQLIGILMLRGRQVLLGIGIFVLLLCVIGLSSSELMFCISLVLNFGKGKATLCFLQEGRGPKVCH
jgi:hypothetical protein